MTHFVVARDSVGWARSRYLTPYHGCVADPYEIMDDLEDDELPPEDMDPDEAIEQEDEAERMVGAAVSARTHAFLDGRRQEVFLFGSPGRHGHESLVAVYRTYGDCALERISTYYVPGVLDEHFFTETLPTGGETLVLISYSDGAADAARGFMQWRAYRLGTNEIVWQARLPTAAYLDRHHGAGVSGTRDRAGRSQGGDTVLTVREPGGVRTNYVWDGSALAPSADPEAAASDEPAAE